MKTVALVIMPLLFVAACANQDDDKAAAGKPDGDTATYEQTNTPVIELREGGDIQPQPHPSKIRIYADGRVRTPADGHTIAPEEVEKLLARIEGFGFFEMNSDQLVSQLREAGELQQIIEGGHGFVTLAARRRGKENAVSLSHPDLYVKTTVDQVKRFREILAAARAIADQ
ncbi:MAG: hypothetical protein HQ592_15280 [Planctomycetes bacterium]|nr:hypothetical protein [Planctomycetota bacterium]